MDLRSFRRPEPSLRMSQRHGGTEAEVCMGVVVFCPDLCIPHKEQRWFENPTAEVVYTCRHVCLFFLEIESALKTR